MNPIQGFSPDAPTTEPGVLLDCEDFIPYESGMTAAPSAVNYATAIAATCVGAATLTKTGGTRRVFAGTASKLYELNGTSWTDRSRAGGYTLGATVDWSLAQFGDTSLAVNPDTVLQSTTSGAFADLTAPKAKIVEPVLSSGGGFVFLFSTNEATYGLQEDRWWCSALNDVTSWTPSVTTQCATGRLLGATGPITAAKQLGSDRIAVYKAGSIYVGNYAGPPTVWDWQEIPIYGAAGLRSVCDIGTAHFVVGQEEIYIFDGARPVPVATGKLRQWFLDNSSAAYRYKTTVVFDRPSDQVWIFYVSLGSSTGTLDRVLVYHLKTGQWGRANRTVETAFIFNTPADTFDGSSGVSYDADSGTFDAVAPGENILAIFDSSHVLQTLNGSPGASSFTLHDIGDDSMVSRLTRARLRYMTKPTTASLSAFSSMATGVSVTTGDMQSAYDVPANGDNSFPLRQTARWHRLKFNFTGPCRVVGYDVPLIPAGNR